MNKIIKLLLVTIFILVLCLNVYAEKSQDKIIIGTSADYPPFEWVDSDGNYVGFDMDLMRLIAISEGYEIEIKDLGFDALIPALQMDKVDIVAASVGVNSERDKVIDFSKAYWETDQIVLVQENSELNILSALSENKKVGVQRGSTQYNWIEKNLLNKDVVLDLKLYETTDSGILDLVNGRLDAFVTNVPNAKVFSENNPIKMVGAIYTGEKIAFAVKEGDPKNLLPLLNSGLNKLEGQLKSHLEEAYFAGNLKNIDKAYKNNKHYLTEEKDLLMYVQNLAKTMTSE